MNWFTVYFLLRLPFLRKRYMAFLNATSMRVRLQIESKVHACLYSPVTCQWCGYLALKCAYWIMTLLICTIVGGVITSILKHLARKAGTSGGPIQVLHTICRNIKATTYLQINANTYKSIQKLSYHCTSHVTK